MTSRVLGLVVSAAGGAEEVLDGLIRPAQWQGWQVAVTMTPTAVSWLAATGVAAEIESVTGLPVRSVSRLPGEASPHPKVTCYVVAPASANTVAKLALGIGDNQALTQVCEAIGLRSVPIIVFPRINAAHAGHPAWPEHLRRLRSAGVQLIEGEDVWPLTAPRSGLRRPHPWSEILEITKGLLHAKE
ncbi:phosphopantothenoylcysteine synthetase/decarboxylase [Actinoalloteichus hoggarensis]|uniref:Bifunctional phosphopantothenoylcysteine decarboxylase/phosphopantothenate synthase n=1 Tax=Actinoalloteichus hoggarensis TaxID=1470176 RepID=A0A221VZE0_9PSEU|nr:flavoprotein [Actinoalloteichus hoggarensis]ASO18860.1 bifunctional phosphopantothenoylcysteine decarboxylase/phosphopantothenate synthase [Actinoalloteichus hoggarensis]MBB5920095.1 phosphopantothenoylcysteine synthetase/decarboxylase [Actinoalloteichus hoggarensis]